MEGKALKLPAFKLPKIALPRPTRWDFFAIGALVLGLVLTGANLAAAGNKALTPLFITGQLVVCCGGLLLLGKTAKEGTWWGNLASIGAMLVGMSGVLLAAALWAVA